MSLTYILIYFCSDFLPNYFYGISIGYSEELLERLRAELREKENVIEELNEQIKKLQDVVIEYAKSDDETQILKYNGTSDQSALIVKDSKKDPKQVESDTNAQEKTQTAQTTNRTKQVIALFGTRNLQMDKNKTLQTR